MITQFPKSSCLSQHVKQGETAEINSEVCEKVLPEMLKHALKESFSILERTVMTRPEYNMFWLWILLFVKSARKNFKQKLENISH
jgi:hypothetical protein